VTARRKRREHLWIALAIIFAVAAATLAAIVLRRSAPTLRSVRASIEPPPKSAFKFDDNDSASLTLSPDGRYITYAAMDDAGKTTLWIRAVDSLDAHPIEGSEDGRVSVLVARQPLDRVRRARKAEAC
jgi:hypothetical protein